MIEREEVRFVAAADWTDDCRVTVELRKRRTTLTVTEARVLVEELRTAIAEAERGAVELAHGVEPAAFDQLELLSPDCRAGKHPMHPDEAWDDAADVEVPCTCACHAEGAAA